MLKVTFLYHSAFLVELSHCSLLFDWYGMNQENSNKNPVINSTQRDYMAGEVILCHLVVRPQLRHNL